jgi:hypothetical protein
MKSISCSLLVLLLWAGTVSGQHQKWLGTAQFAGSIGYLSVGVGYVHTKTLQSELLYGFVPGQYGGPGSKFTYRFLWQPFTLPIHPRWNWKPIGTSVFLSYSIDKDLTLVPSYSKYQKDYYWWSTALRKHIGFQTAFERHNPTRPGPKTQYYMEWNTNDLYMVAYWENRNQMRLDEIFYLGFGIRRFF